MLADQGIDLALFEPTANGLYKNFVDATARVRKVLIAHQIHDYDAQAFGAKVEMPIELIHGCGGVPSTVAFFCANTRGDRRMRITNLPGL